MTHKYETGSKGRVLQYMCDCAIRDRFPMWEGLSDDEPEKKIVEAEIRDFKRLGKILINYCY